MYNKNLKTKKICKFKEWTSRVLAGGSGLIGNPDKSQVKKRNGLQKCILTLLLKISVYLLNFSTILSLDVVNEVGRNLSATIGSLN